MSTTPTSRWAGGRREPGRTEAAEGLGHRVLETPGWEAGAATQALEPWPLSCCEPLLL